MKLKDKNIVIGITGGIAAYKIPEMIRLLRSAGANVRVIMTKAAKAFVTPLTLQTVSGQAVYDELFDQSMEFEVGHIIVARWAHAIVIAPATANIIAKLACGIADDLLTTVCLAARSPLVVVPAMNQAMWHHHATERNVASLRKNKVHVWGPAKGEQACGEVGFGRMLEPTDIVQRIESLFVAPLLKGKKIMITAGPTQEPMDPVRYITNRSSGKMGYALAEAAVALGATVHLVSGPTTLPDPLGAEVTRVTTAVEMLHAVMNGIRSCDVFIAAAAVGDFSPRRMSPKKLKKNKKQKTMTMTLVKNTDILSSVAKIPSPPLTVGFAAETHHLLASASAKIKNKKIDIIAANWVGFDKGFGRDDNALTILTSDGKRLEWTSQSKRSLADKLLNLVVQYMK